MALQRNQDPDARRNAYRLAMLSQAPVQPVTVTDGKCPECGNPVVTVKPTGGKAACSVVAGCSCRWRRAMAETRKKRPGKYEAEWQEAVSPLPEVSEPVYGGAAGGGMSLYGDPNDMTYIGLWRKPNPLIDLLLRQESTPHKALLRMARSKARRGGSIAHTREWKRLCRSRRITGDKEALFLPVYGWSFSVPIRMEDYEPVSVPVLYDAAYATSLTAGAIADADRELFDLYEQALSGGAL